MTRYLLPGYASGANELRAASRPRDSDSSFRGVMSREYSISRSGVTTANPDRGAGTIREFSEAVGHSRVVRNWPVSELTNNACNRKGRDVVSVSSRRGRDAGTARVTNDTTS